MLAVYLLNINGLLSPGRFRVLRKRLSAICLFALDRVARCKCGNNHLGANEYDTVAVLRPSCDEDR